MNCLIVRAAALIAFSVVVPAADAGELPSTPIRFAVDRNGDRPVPVMTARDHCNTTGFQRVNGHLAKLRDGCVLFSYGDRASDFSKKGLGVMASVDGGETWSEPVRLIDWNGLDGGYPSSVQRADGQVVTLPIAFPRCPVNRPIPTRAITWR
jgi:hypothetical protein